MQSLTEWLSSISLTDPLVWVAFASGLGVVLTFLFLGRRQPRNPEVVLSSQPATLSPDMIAPPPVNHHDERRKSIRRTGMPTPVMLMDYRSTKKVKPLPGYVLDRSSGGIRLAVEQPFPVGTMLKIRPTNAPSDFDWVQLVVRSSREAGDYFELGCQFEANLPLSQLLMFG